MWTLRARRSGGPGRSRRGRPSRPLQLYEIDTPATLEAESAALARMGRCDACGRRAPELWARDDRARCGPCALEDLAAEGLIRLVEEDGR